MKRTGGLFETMWDLRTLNEAAWRAAQGKRWRPEVNGFLSNLNRESSRMSREIRDGNYRFGDYRRFRIRDPKTRTIHAPPFRDRVAHHAIVLATGWTFERGAIRHSYACRPGRGQHAALRQARAWMGRTDWFLKIDVAKYYDSIEHGRLMDRLERRFRERRLLKFFGRLLESYEASPAKGLPIGALTSQYLGNFFLDPIDHQVNEILRHSRYLRYMDDLLLIGKAESVKLARDRVAEMLSGIGLRPKGDGVLNRCVEGVPFLGFVLYPDRTRLNRPGRRRLRRKLKGVELQFEQGGIAERELQSRGEALFAHPRFGDDVAWRRMVAGFSRLKNFGEAHEPAPEPGDARRLLEQHREEQPRRLSEQEQAVEPQQEHRLPCLSGAQHDGSRDDGSQSQPADHAPSRARLSDERDETKGKPPTSAEIRAGNESEKADAGAPEVTPLKEGGKA